MTEARANEIFRTKYPTGEIINGKRFGGSCAGRMVVIFQEGGKCYDYGATSYQAILERFGFKILYKHNVAAYERQIADLEKRIADGGEQDFFDASGWHTYSSDELGNMRDEIRRIKCLLAESICE